MDDFDHSVLIAEQDWDYFYTESEECSVQQAKLAFLDESGLSDVDDDKTSISVSSAPPQISPYIEEKQHASISQNSELTECSSLKNDFAGQTCDARLKDQGTTSECFCLDNSNEEISATEPSDLVTNNLRGNGENQGENKATSSLCYQDENGSENAITRVTHSSPALRKEKERWFVTVNDSPVRLREKVGTSGQKKRRKKKLSKNGNQQSGGRDSLSALNNNAEKIKEFSDRRKFERPPKSGSDDLLSNTCLNNGHKKNYLSNSCNIQEEIEHTPDNSVQSINNRGEGSPKFILGASTPTDPLNSESTGQQELFEQSKNEKELPSSQDTICLQSSNTRSKTPDLGPTRPIFAISSFWDEMEKLTINDILDLRLANNMSPLKKSIIPDQSNFLDTVDAHEVDFKDDSIEDIGLVEDAADSDYFTHLDDCKPDRSSCEFSTFSDYDEEFPQHHGFSTNPSPEPCEIKTQRFLEPTCAKSFLQDDKIWPSNEIVRLYPEGHLFSEAQSQIRDTFLTTNQGVSCFLLDHFDIRRPTPSPVLSMSDVVDDHCLLSMIEILNDTDSEQFRTSRTSNRHISVPFPQNPSVPEMYEDFFTDFEVGNFFFPSVQGTKKFEKNMVPIYSSSSRSLVKEMIQSDSEDESTPIQVVAHCNSSGSPNMCFITDRRNPWRNLSLRRIKFSFMERIWFRMATSWVSPKIPIDDKVFQENWNIGTTSNSSLTSISLLENQALGNLTEKQIYASSTFSGPGIDRFRFSIKQADMCLVCIAFASWVLKSINPQSTDMWKAALLANVSAISAIQYLRRYVNEEDEP